MSITHIQRGKPKIFAPGTTIVGQDMCVSKICMRIIFYRAQSSILNLLIIDDLLSHIENNGA